MAEPSADRAPAAPGAEERLRIVTLCGSTRFKQEFIAANFAETMAGNIVLTVGWFGHADADIYAPTPEEKARLDWLHLRKIDLSDEVVLIAPGGYVGESTAREVAYARERGIPIRWWEKEHGTPPDAARPAPPPDAVAMEEATAPEVERAYQAWLEWNSPWADRNAFAAGVRWAEARREGGG